MMCHTRSLALVTLFALPTFAQAQSPAGNPTPTTDPWTATHNLNFEKTLSVETYIEQLRQSGFGNILLLHSDDIDTKTVMLPPMHLRNVTTFQAVHALELLPSVDVKVEAETSQLSPAAEPIFVVRVTLKANSATIRSTNLVVFPLERMLIGSSPKDRVPDDAERAKILVERVDQLMQLADEAFAMVPPSGEKPELKYHAPTHTLLVKANSEDAERVRTLIVALEIPTQTVESAADALARRSVMVQQEDNLNKQLERENRELQAAVDGFESQKSVATSRPAK